MLKFEVIPGKSVGPFVLGMAVGAAVAWTRQHERDVAQVELAVDVEGGVQLTLVDEGLRLFFSPHLQTLQLIHAFALGPLPLEYQGRPIAGGRATEVQPSLATLYAALGPTYPGEWLGKLYQLNYPGLGLVLPDGPGHGEPPTTLQATELLVFRGRRQAAPEAVPRERSAAGYLRAVWLEAGVGLRLDDENGPEVRLGAHAQDARAELGLPSGRHTRDDARMRIHADSPGPEGAAAAAADVRQIAQGSSNSVANEGDEGDKIHLESQGQDYFLVWASLGLDLLLDGRSHLVRGVIAHSNWPQHDGFFEYDRCNWSVVGTHVAVGQRWTDISRRELKIDANVEPVVHTRPIGLKNTLTTHYYGRDGLIVEVLPTGEIETVQIY